MISNLRIWALFCGWWALCAAVGVPKNERDLFDDFADEIRPIAEAERLKRLYPENEKFIANIPSRYYEVIYPVQVRQHQKMGVLTRETDANKTGKHYYSTSLLVKAFNYKFKLDLELNTHLLAPNLIQKHFLPEGIQRLSTQEIEQCYYHGTIKEYPGGIAALRTCNGISGVIHVGNETFVIHPFYGGDLSRKHPHVLFRFFPENKGKHTCGNTGMHEWGFKQFRIRPPTRIKRDVRQVYKYIELALVIDQAMFENRNSTKAEVVSDAIQILNCVDLYFKTVNTRVSVVYVETWAHGDQIDIIADVRQTLLNLLDYTSRKLYKVAKDATHLITGKHFRGSEVGMAVPDSICTAKAVGISEDTNIYEPQLVASTITHMLGHNLGMGHDHTDGTGGPEDCKCQDWWSCIMSQNILGESKIQPYHFSSCSLQDYIRALRVGHGICLFNKPNQLEDFRTCGNGVIEDGEQCDCGSIEECLRSDPCCDPITCKLRVEAECSAGPCCENCKLRPSGHLCRPALTECDIPEFCDGRSGQCPTDLYKKNASPCNNGEGFCYHGNCPTPDNQCEYLWGYGAVASEQECFVRFNTQGSLNGNCGTDGRGGYVKCAEENVRCGSLQCQRGSRTPLVPGMDKQYSRTIVYLGGSEYECKAVQKFDTSNTNKSSAAGYNIAMSGGTLSVPDIPDLGMVRDGTKCAEEKICVNQTCVSITQFIEPGNCPTSHMGLVCSGHGVCSNLNSCYCDRGWTSYDCSQRADERAHPEGFGPIPNLFTTPEAPSTAAVADWKNKTIRSSFVVTKGSTLSTPSLVIVLVTIVGSVFIFFALLATCYRRSGILPKGASDYLKKRFGKKLHMPLAKKMDGSQENVNRIITFGSMPSYREDKLQELQRRQQDTPPKLPVESSQPMGDMSTFIELSPDNLTRVPEKGILKHGRPDNWEDGDDQGDENNVDSSSDVERTLKNINGYHEEILEALHSASQRMGDSKRSPSQDSHKSVVDMNYSALGSVKGRDDQRDDDLEEPMPVPIRIRNLEDLLRQLEHHPLQPQQQQHMSPACSDEIRLSEPEADRHYLLGRQDRSGSEGKVDPGLQYLLGRLQASGASSAKRGHHYSLEEDDDIDDQSGDDEGSTYSSHQLVRSASEEALPVTSRRDYSYSRKSKARRVPEPCDYAPSPPPSEDSYANSSEENAFLPPPAPPSIRGARTAKVEPEPLGPPSAVSTGSLPSGAKRKGKKKFPEYKVSSLRNQRW
ncbi:disintegrin and metalloproteinase domain-containing protein 11-like isoform X5 [Argiope bruennichi]|uniref:disintegrin and metalloproteinase domain-containing protein 11-like isoform X5 n=1 Tax=Argiope bruennichi TaxID=94029 RepID=UPI0024950665|nr:disintegrin and metalloproteinase domain-containing protein 11-like isoform X5 [Argiope bruennichi]